MAFVAMERSVADAYSEAGEPDCVETSVYSDADVPRAAVSASQVQADSADHVQVDGAADSATIDSARHPVFVFSYIANLALVTANAITFVFADWVAWLATNKTPDVQYQEELPGRIVQYGVLAAISARIFLGQAIDRFGVRRVWLLVSCLALTGVVLFTSMEALSGLLPAGRILFAVGLAGMFTCSTFHIQSCVEEHRRTEFIALLGSSGFVGMILGSQLADLLRWVSSGNPAIFFPSVFATASVLFGLNIACVFVITRGMSVPMHPFTRPSLIRLTRDYWPGMITVVAMMMGVIFTVPSLYLIRFNQHEGFGGIAAYWTTYAVMAFMFRIRTAGLSQKVGRHRLVFVGLLFQGMGLWALIPVTQWWHLLFSATLCGFGHAFLFPSIVSLGSGTFPSRYRGSGTNLTLGCLDLGVGLSAPLMGRIIDMERFGGAGFRQMFFCAGALPVIVAVIWYVAHRHSADSEVHGAGHR